ncbi:MAG TPA: ABC transporter permease, partial [Chloroflexi bacterium]|nr:ABC transporter permease [Chloroflexota bacterium]
GIDVTSPLYDPIRSALVAGTFLEADDRNGVLLGKRLADSLGLGVGDTIRLTTINANGEPEEAPFVIRGLFASGVLVYDEATIFMPLAKAQSFTLTGNRASTVMVQLHDQDDADAVAAALAQPGLQVLTWRQLNAFFLDTIGAAMSFYILFDGIVMLIVAV